MSMFSDDHLIIGNQISNLMNIPKIIDYYNSKEIFNFTTSVISDYGLNPESNEFGSRWNENKKRLKDS
jgi:hypothetical protein